MKRQFELSIEAEHFIHNDLSNCAWSFSETVKAKVAADDMQGIYHHIMAALVFSAFTLEAKVNFVGWKVLQDGWPERANLREKIMLLGKVLDLELDWGARPLQTFSKTTKLRDTLAHGKPSVVDKVEIVDEEPEIWEVLKGQWENSVTPELVELVAEDLDAFWRKLLDAANIEIGETLTHGGHSLRQVIETT